MHKKSPSAHTLTSFFFKSYEQTDRFPHMFMNVQAPPLDRTLLSIMQRSHEFTKNV